MLFAKHCYRLLVVGIAELVISARAWTTTRPEMIGSSRRILANTKKSSSSLLFAHDLNNNNFQSETINLDSHSTTTSSSTGGGGSRRDWFKAAIAASSTTLSISLTGTTSALAADDIPLVYPEGDAKRLFNEGQALEAQGNISAAQRLYAKVTKLSPRFIYGWSNLGNTQVALGNLEAADESYTNAINLCQENLQLSEGFGVKRCANPYVLYLNRGSLRLNTSRPRLALDDLMQSTMMRGRPDGVVAQNLARAYELNGKYQAADREYSLAVAMSGKDVAPFWLRSALVKYQLGEYKDGLDLFRKVEQRFPNAPEVIAANAVFMATDMANNGANGNNVVVLGGGTNSASKPDMLRAQLKFMEIPPDARAKYFDSTYLTETIAWPPAMIQTLSLLTKNLEDANIKMPRKEIQELPDATAPPSLFQQQQQGNNEKK